MCKKMPLPVELTNIISIKGMLPLLMTENQRTKKQVV